MILRQTRRVYFINLILFLIIFQSILEQVIAPFKFFDELLSLVVFAYGMMRLFTIRHVKYNKYVFVMVLSVFVYFLIGSISAFLYQYQSVTLSAAGVFLSVKWFMLMLGGYYFFQCFVDENEMRSIKSAVSVYIVIYMLCILFQYTGMNLYIVYPWDRCAKCVFMAAIIISRWENSIKDWVSIGVLAFMLFLVHKAKGDVAILLIVGCIIWIILLKKKINIMVFSLGALAALFVAKDKIYYYFVRGKAGDWARYRLMATATEIAGDYFPLGTGWSTYGSHYSVGNYSRVYYLYGIDKHPELGVETKYFLNDNYWACVIAETGWLGALAILIFCIALFFIIQKYAKVNRKYYAAGLLVWGYMMITTMEETGFAQPVLACLGIMSGALFALMKKSTEIENSENRNIT